MRRLKTAWLLVGLALTILTLGTCEASAQQAYSLEQLQLLVKPGDHVKVTESGGAVTRGSIVDLTNSSLQLMANGKLRNLEQRDILEIRQRRRDSLDNGAKYGAIAGGSFGVLAAVGTYVMVDRCIGCSVGIAALFTGMGAGIGIGIDAIIVREKTIFAAAQRSSRNITVKPLLTDNRKGLSISWSF